MQIEDLHKLISLKPNEQDGIDVHLGGRHVLRVANTSGGYVWMPVDSFFTATSSDVRSLPYHEGPAHDELHTAIASGIAALYDNGFLSGIANAIDIPADTNAEPECCAESTDRAKRLLSFLKESKKNSDRIKNDPCWKGYKMVGMKKKGNKEVPNCVPESVEQIEELTAKQKKIDLNKNGKVDGEDLAKLRNMKKEEVELHEEEHPELKKIRDEYESREGKGSFDRKTHEYSDDHRAWKAGTELQNRYRTTKANLVKSGVIKEDAVLNEAVTVDKKTYKWGKMVTVHHGNKDSYPLHPEHQEAIKNLKDGDKTKFKDETKRVVTAHRIGNSILLSHPQSNKATSVAHSHFTESLELTEKLSDKATAKDYIEDFVKSDAPQFKGKSKSERIKMALGAFYSKNESAMSTILGYTKKKPKVEPKEEPTTADSDKVVKDESGLHMDKDYAKKYGFVKEDGTGQDGTGQLLGGVNPDLDPTNKQDQLARADYRLTPSGRKVKRRITFKDA